MIFLAIATSYFSSNWFTVLCSFPTVYSVASSFLEMNRTFLLESTSELKCCLFLVFAFSRNLFFETSSFSILITVLLLCFLFLVKEEKQRKKRKRVEVSRLPFASLSFLVFLFFLSIQLPLFVFPVVSL